MYLVVIFRKILIFFFFEITCLTVGETFVFFYYTGVLSHLMSIKILNLQRFEIFRFWTAQF